MVLYDVLLVNKSVQGVSQSELGKLILFSWWFYDYELNKSCIYSVTFHVYVGLSKDSL